ncbi:Na+/H+ antiporter family protein [Alkalicoccobacillus plakortidis]|uniref:Na+/H+ antiporter family protein n=1 Tax=Alkalicoccobacillus plakortidis TaxID=444060 RepID=A0ABT0XK09_9BACI|nr:Na+/H+ antiporter family protein [Alkalicoccobacillus plakortidis]MCM2676226.1 Na+/H+ antiporter family protein [Alkalicoccobacillus plakortidis]
MNAVVIAVLLMIILSLLRVHVVIALIIGALTGGILGGLGFNGTIDVFTEGLGHSANIALSYAVLGAFAVALSKTGLPQLLVDFSIKIVGKKEEIRSKTLPKVLIFLIIFFISGMSQNLVPIHIAFIPILIPPILQVLNEMAVDRRAVASIMTFGLQAPYMLLPFGFGAIFHGIVVDNMEANGMTASLSDMPYAMLLPTIGMFLGLIVAVFITYRKPRLYKQKPLEAKINDEAETITYSVYSLISAATAILATVIVQISSDSMVIAGVAGLIVLVFSGSVRFKESDALLTEGMKMMAFIGFVMIAASGFAEVMRATGDVEQLVQSSAAWMGDSKSLAAIMMILIGLLITMGIGSSFATVPIIAALFVPMCAAMGFSPLATLSLIGTAGAIGDAGAPASDSTLGPTAGLNADGQHNHIWDTCVPTFIHFNIPLIIFGWIAAVTL